jgi:hypothetical protein
MRLRLGVRQGDCVKLDGSKRNVRPSGRTERLPQFTRLVQSARSVAQITW